jgi:hypothetical protein
VGLVIASVLSEKPIRRDMAMTGEVSLRGKVLMVGGLREKALAAYRAGFRTLLFPSVNLKDLGDIPPDVRDRLELVPVETMDEVFEIARVGSVRRPGKTVVAADEDTHAALAQLGEHFLRALELIDYAVQLRFLVGDAPGLGLEDRVVEQSDCRRDEDPVTAGLEKVEALLVGVFAVVKNIDLAFERQLDRCRRADVSRDPFAVRMCRTCGRAHLVVAHDGLVRTRAWDRLISRDVQLERIHSLPQQGPAGTRHLIDAVDNHGDRFAVDVHAPFVAQISCIRELGTGCQ